MRSVGNLAACPGRVLVCLGLVVAVGCEAPIRVQRASPERVHRKLTETVLSSGELSQATRNILRLANLLSVYETDPALALETAHELLTQRARGRLSELTERGLVAVAEASFLYASESGDRRYFVMAAIYAWAFLFARDKPIDPVDPRVRLAARLYNRGLTLALLPDQVGEPIELSGGTLELPIGTLEIELDPAELEWGDRQLTHFKSVADLSIRGLSNRYRIQGIGAPLAGSTRVRPGREPEADPIHDEVQVPVSLVLYIEDVWAGLRSGRLRGRARIHDFLEDPWVEVSGRRMPAELEPSASLALMYSKIEPWRNELQAFFEGDLKRGRDGLTSLSLHQPGRIPVILVHGTASSVTTWANMLNDLVADRELRQHYQLWLFTYNTGSPILYSASLLRRAIADAVRSLDPEGLDPALRRAVVIGHSQGGLLAKLMAVESGDRFWEQISDRPFEELDMQPETRELVESALFVEPSPYVGRVVFIATPHRGSYLLNWGPTSLLRGLVRAPSSVLRATADLVKQNPESMALRQIDDVQGSLGEMNPSSPFLAALLALPPQVPAHSIIAVREFAEKDDATDGVVRYRSAQLAEVESEVVVESGHSCLDHPQVVLEVRRVLLMHLGPHRHERDAPDTGY